MSVIGKLMDGLERRYKVCSLLSPLTMAGEVFLEIVIPLLMAKIIDVGIENRNLPYVLGVGGIMILFSLLSLSCGALGGRFAAVASLGFARNLRRRLFSKVQDFSFGNVDHFSSSSLVTRLTTDVTNVQNTYQMVIRMCVRAPFMLVSGTVMACIINLRLSVVFFVVMPVIIIALVIMGFTAYPRFKVMLSHYDTMNNTVQENLTAIRVVKSYVREDHENEKFRKAAEAVRSAQVRAEKIVILGLPFMQLMIYGCIIAVMWFGGRLVVSGSLKTGELVSFITYITQILMSLMMLSMVFITIVLSRASITRIVEVLDEVPEIKNSSDQSSALLTKVEDGSIDFENVDFSYLGDSENTVLSDINLHIDSGAMVGIIGGTGSSKTTLVSLIPRLYDTLHGSVKVGGHNVKEYDVASLRESVAMVLQKNVLFSGSIKENLLWGNENASDSEIVNACIASDADEFIKSFPDGYDTELGQGGVNLSGGQKQRLCIARALLKNPRILILDDSTSACDTATDARIREALRKTLPQTTKLIIAQRIKSVQDADLIFVMDNGRINGVGTHSQLLENNAIYKEVWESQH